MNEYKQITDFHASRLNGVGASDIPTLAGLTKQYDETPVTLWRQKMQIDPGITENEKMRWGHILEPVVLEEFKSRLQTNEVPGLELLFENRKKYFYDLKTECFHPEYNYCLAHADAVYSVGSDYNFIVEAKTSGFYAANRRDNPDSGYDKDDLSENGIPAAVYLQIQYQMFVYGVDVAYVAVLIDTSDFRVYGPIPSNPSIQSKCLALARRFWDCIESKTPPAPSTFNDIQLLFPNPQKKSMIISGEQLTGAELMQKQYHKITAAEKRLKDKKNDIRLAISSLFGGNDTLMDTEGKTIATYKSSSKTSISVTESKKHKKIFELLELEKLINISVFNKLTIKKLKEN